MHSRTALVSLLLTMVGAAVLASPGHALPLFARKYEMKCTSCHIAFPRLNAFGRAFRQNGYRLPGAVGNSPWEDKAFPLSLVANVGVDYASTLIPAHGAVAASRTSASQFQQNAVEFHTAGTLAPHLTFHFDSNFEGVNQGLASGMAFLQFDDLAKGGGLNIKAGIFDADTPYLAASRSLTMHDYLSPITLDAQGIELNGAHTGWTYAAAVINSGRTTGSPTSTKFNTLENFYAWVMRDIHGHELTARVVLDEQDPRAAGKNASKHVTAEMSSLVNFSRGTLTPLFTYQKNDDADVDHPEKLYTGMLEGVLLLDAEGKWVAIGRYELEHQPKNDALATAERDFYLANLDLSYYVNPNARVGIDYARTASNHTDEPRVDEVQAFVHIGY